MADQHRDDDASSPPAVAKAVSKITVKALQELNLSDMDEEDQDFGLESEEEEEKKSRPSSATQGGASTLLRNLGEGVGRVDSDSEADDEGREDDISSASDLEGDAEPDLVVLDPDHPLMKRFQSKLKEQLAKQLEKARLEKKELTDMLKKKQTEREDVGVTLYGVQQELARQQMNLEQLQDKHSISSEMRRNKEAQLAKLRDAYKQCHTQVEKERKKNSDLQTEIENLATRLFYMKTAKEDVRSDISVMKRAAEKAEVEINQAEIEKKKQDLYVDRLIERMTHLREEIAMYEAQQSAQSEETSAAKEALSEAKMEIDSINVEKKQLYQQWTSSLIGMKRRDEAHSAMHEALGLANQRVKSLETEIDGYKKSIQKEEEKNETLTMILNKAETDITMTKKLIKQSLSKQENIKHQYGTYNRTLHETEIALNRATTERSIKLNEINVIRKQVEREYLEKVKLEDEIMAKIQHQLTADKAKTYSVKITNEIRNRKMALEADMAQVENQVAQSSRHQLEIKSRIRKLLEQKEELETEIQSRNELISKAERDTNKRNAIIERKQTIIDQNNKKIEQLIAISGGEEIGPLEIQVNSLTKQIDGLDGDITGQQQFWLRQQHELVRLSKEKSQQLADLQTLKKQHTILLQKKLRIEGEIEQQLSEQREIDRSIRSMQNSMIKLNTQLTNERGIQTNLEQGNVLTENEFMQELKDAETNSIETQQKLDGLKEEKERLLNSLVESERQIMLWEKKTQLAKETRAAVESDVGQGEIHAMKAEIHRMQVRYGQLMKQQEQMIREMEQVVSRRETITTRGEAQSKIDKKTLTKGTFQKKLSEIKKKIKTTQKDAESCDEDIRQLRENQTELSKNLEDKQIAVQQLQGQVDGMERDADLLADQKFRNLTDIVSMQTKYKHLQSFKSGKYTMLCKTKDAIINETDKQEERMNKLINILDRLSQDYPHAQQALHKATLVLGSQGMTTEDA